MARQGRPHPCLPSTGRHSNAAKWVERCGGRVATEEWPSQVCDQAALCGVANPPGPRALRDPRGGPNSACLVRLRHRHTETPPSLGPLVPGLGLPAHLTHYCCSLDWLGCSLQVRVSCCACGSTSLAQLSVWSVQSSSNADHCFC